jgi:hypothetical protein
MFVAIMGTFMNLRRLGDGGAVRGERYPPVSGAPTAFDVRHQHWPTDPFAAIDDAVSEHSQAGARYRPSVERLDSSSRDPKTGRYLKSNQSVVLEVPTVVGSICATPNARRLVERLLAGVQCSLLPVAGLLAAEARNGVPDRCFVDEALRTKQADRNLSAPL